MPAGQVFLRFLSAQALAIIPCGLLVGLSGSLHGERPVAETMMVTVALLLMAMPGMLTTSALASACARFLRRVPLPAVAVLAVLWGCIGFVVSGVLTSPDMEEAQPDAPAHLAFLIGCALLPLLAAWWWTRGGQAAAALGNAGPVRPRPAGPGAAPPPESA